MCRNIRVLHNFEPPATRVSLTAVVAMPVNAKARATTWPTWATRPNWPAIGIVATKTSRSSGTQTGVRRAMKSAMATSNAPIAKHATQPKRNTLSPTSRATESSEPASIALCFTRARKKTSSIA